MIGDPFPRDAPRPLNEGEYAAVQRLLMAAHRGGLPPAPEGFGHEALMWGQLWRAGFLRQNGMARARLSTRGQAYLRQIGLIAADGSETPAAAIATADCRR